VSQTHKTLTQRDTETYARLTAPQHITYSHFTRHQTVEGFHEWREVPEFAGSDRLWKMDTLYGTIQLGYNPRKGKSFLFANIKTSVYDSAALRHQRELKEYQMARYPKSGTSNTAYTAKRRAQSAVILYNMDPLPWSRRSVAPYLHTVNMEALRKTMPFLDKTREVWGREESAREQKRLQGEIASRMRERRYGEMAGPRARQTELAARQNDWESLIRRKDTQQRLFFRKMNAALDMQKKEMYAYYRDRRRSGGSRTQGADALDNKPDEEKNG